VVTLSNGDRVLVEIKGEERERDRAKHQAAQRWISAVNNWGREGRWHFVVSRDPQRIGDALRHIAESM